MGRRRTSCTDVATSTADTSSQSCKMATGTIRWGSTNVTVLFPGYPVVVEAVARSLIDPRGSPWCRPRTWRARVIRSACCVSTNPLPDEPLTSRLTVLALIGLWPVGFFFRMGYSEAFLLTLVPATHRFHAAVAGCGAGVRGWRSDGNPVGRSSSERGGARRGTYRHFTRVRSSANFLGRCPCSTQLLGTAGIHGISVRSLWNTFRLCTGAAALGLLCPRARGHLIKGRATRCRGTDLERVCTWFVPVLGSLRVLRNANPRACVLESNPVRYRSCRCGRRLVPRMLDTPGSDTWHRVARRSLRHARR